MNIPRNTPVFFKKEAETEETKPNAVFLRDMGMVNNEPCCEIEWRQEKWLVRYSEALTPALAMQKTARRFKEAIEATPNPSRSEETAKALGIHPSTLRRRRKFIENHLVNTP